MDKPAKQHRAPQAGRSADKKKPADKAAEKNSFNPKVTPGCSLLVSAPFLRTDPHSLACSCCSGVRPDLGSQCQPPRSPKGRARPDETARPPGRPNAGRRPAACRRRRRRTSWSPSPLSLCLSLLFFLHETPELTALPCSLRSQVGKSTLVKSLVKRFTKHNLTDIRGPVTVVSGALPLPPLLSLSSSLYTN